MNNIGVLYQRLNKLHGAHSTLQASLAMLRRIHGARPHADIVRGLSNLGYLYRQMGNDTDSDAMFALAQSIQFEADLLGVGGSNNLTADGMVIQFQG